MTRTTVQPAEELLPPYLGAQLSALRRRVETSNMPGSRDGLLARHFLRGLSDIAWSVDPFAGTWIDDNRLRLEEPGRLAVLGYRLSADGSDPAEIVQVACRGLRRLMGRRLLPGDRTSVFHDIGILIGIHLLAKKLRSEVPEFQPWLRTTLTQQHLRAADPLHDLVQQHILAAIVGEAVALTIPGTLTRGVELAMAWWMLNEGTATLIEPVEGRHALRRLILQAGLRADPTHLTAPRAALVLSAVDDILNTSIDQIMLDRSDVSRVLRRFEAAMRRWRWDSEDLTHPIRWEIRSEREVQDVLWLMLRSVFEDVVDEDPLPKLGHSSFRTDFGIPTLGVLVEVKYVYKASDFKKIESQVMVDAAAYLEQSDRYREIIVFIYDESSSVEHHDVTQQALMKLSGVSDVVIVSRPGMLPNSTRRPGSDSN